MTGTRYHTERAQWSRDLRSARSRLATAQTMSAHWPWHATWNARRRNAAADVRMARAALRYLRRAYVYGA